jgi:cyclin B
MLGRYLIEIALLDYSMLKYKPSEIACAAIYLVNKIKKRVPAWSDDVMKRISGVGESEVRPCAKDLCSIL